MEKKGSLFLRSDHMEYDRPTLVSHWHEARESEPRDYNIKDFEPNARDLHRSTYDRIGVVTDGTFPRSTCHSHLDQIYLKKDFQEQVMRQPVLNGSSVKFIMQQRETGAPLKGYGSILPCHPEGHNRRYLDTTYCTDYRQPYPLQNKPADVKSEDTESTQLQKHKRQHSQFTDVDDYRRHGQNTWHNETGTYNHGKGIGTVSE